MLLLGREAVLTGNSLCVFLCTPGEGRSLVRNLKRLTLRGVTARRSLELLSLLVCLISVFVEFSTGGLEVSYRFQRSASSPGALQVNIGLAQINVEGAFL